VTFYTVFVIDLATRRVQVLDTTPSPDDAFMRQVVRTLSIADGDACRVLICDRDAKWSVTVREWLEEAGIRVVRTPMRPRTRMRTRSGSCVDEAGMSGPDQSDRGRALPTSAVGVCRALQRRFILPHLAMW
jgi:hypothetical protein